MRTSIITLVAMCLLCLTACEKDYIEPIAEEDRIEKSAHVEEGTIVSVLMHGTALEGNLLGDPVDRNVHVYLPKSYYSHPEKRFPVIYFLHGMPAMGEMLFDPLPFELFAQVANLSQTVDFPAEGFVSWLNQLIDGNAMREAIVVFPDSHTLFGVPTYMNSVVHGNYEDYICRDVVNFIDSNFRTIDHFNWRAVSGHCAGGYGALRMAMGHPDIFRSVAALSPAHFPEETFMAMANFMLFEDALWETMGAPAGPLPYDPMQPFKFANNTTYALCQAWLPNLSAPYLADLPFAYVEGVPVPDAERMEQVRQQNLLAVVGNYKKELHRLKLVYFDCGTNDELMMYMPNVMMHDKLKRMHIKHDFYSYEGGHMSHMYERLGIAFAKLSNTFPEEM